MLLPFDHVLHRPVLAGLRVCGTRGSTFAGKPGRRTVGISVGDVF